MVCYPMLWYGMESMVCYKISVLCYEISMLCYAIVYVVKDKHSATVSILFYTHNSGKDTGAYAPPFLFPLQKNHKKERYFLVILPYKKSNLDV